VRGGRSQLGEPDCQPMTRVLVIDDEVPILRALKINLAARKYEVSTAADGA
jgi:two-component system, OmpR family, KDP operon response regulator KdpE